MKLQSATAAEKFQLTMMANRTGGTEEKGAVYSRKIQLTEHKEQRQ